MASYMQGAGRITTHNQLTCAETMKAGVLERWRSSEKLCVFLLKTTSVLSLDSPARHPSRFQSLVSACVQLVKNRGEADQGSALSCIQSLFRRPTSKASILVSTK